MRLFKHKAKRVIRVSKKERLPRFHADAAVDGYTFAVSRKCPVLRAAVLQNKQSGCFFITHDAMFAANAPRGERINELALLRIAPDYDFIFFDLDFVSRKFARQTQQIRLLFDIGICLVVLRRINRDCLRRKSATDGCFAHICGVGNNCAPFSGKGDHNSNKP